MKGKKRKYQKGITLVALVITIIVLLILAGATLSIIFNGGIINKLQTTADKHSEESAREKLSLAILNYKMGVIIGKAGEGEGKKSFNEYISEIGGEITKTTDTTYTIVVDGYEFLVKRDTYEITLNEATSGETETPVTKYTVTFNVNGGTGSMKKQVFEYGVSQRLKPNTFTKEDYIFSHWNTKSDGTGTTYEDEEEVNNLTEASNGTVTLYAIYTRVKYVNNNDIVFDGTNYIDTGIYLFSEKNINRDFEVSFDIKERMTTENYATMMSSMDETGSPWPGMVYRVFNANDDQFAANSPSSKVDKKYKNTNVQKVTLKRICGVIYVNFNDGEDTQMLNLSSITNSFEIPLTFGAALNADKTPFRYFIGTLSNLKVIVTDSKDGSIKFSKNGGSGTEFSQIVAPNSTVTLTKNTYTRTGYEFDGWNTKADGTGTSYADQESVTNIVDKGEKITLYAQWRKYVYTVQFDANGGMGSMEAQEFESTVAQKLNTSTFTKEGYSFAFWNTAVDGSGKSYEDNEEVINLAASNGAIIKLYAIYENYNYEYEGDFIFDGTNFIKTNIYLFSKKNVNKDFEISFEIKERVSNTAYATMMNAMDETGSPYPGFLFRINSTATVYELENNSTKGGEKKYTFPLDSVTKLSLRRVKGILYMKINDDEEQEAIDFSTLKKLFYTPLTFGASLNGKLKPQRYFTGTLSNIRVTLYE